MTSTPETPQAPPEPQTPPESYKFPSSAPPKLCTYNTCSTGHTWPMTLTLTKCPGCSTWVLAARMEQCPVCNEPTELSTVRIDHVTDGMRVSAMCAGEPSAGEIGQVEMRREHAKTVENPPSTPNETTPSTPNEPSA